MNSLKSPKKKSRSKYTLRDLELLGEEYEKNYQKLVRTVNLPRSERMEYIRKERKLYRLDKIIRKELGVYVEDPCPIGSSKNCFECNGWFKRQATLTSNRFVSAKKGEGQYCDYKDFDLKFLKNLTNPEI